MWTTLDGSTWVPIPALETAGFWPPQRARFGWVTAGQCGWDCPPTDVWVSTDGVSWLPLTGPETTVCSLAAVSNDDRIHLDVCDRTTETSTRVVITPTN